MPDITKCANRDCPSRMACHRFTAEPTPHRQSYAHFGPNADECGHYWPNGEGRKFLEHRDGTVEEIAVQPGPPMRVDFVSRGEDGELYVHVVPD